MISHGLSSPCLFPLQLLDPSRRLYPDGQPTANGRGKMGMIGLARPIEATLGHTLKPSYSSARNLSCEHDLTQEKWHVYEEFSTASAWAAKSGKQPKWR